MYIMTLYAVFGNSALASIFLWFAMRARGLSGGIFAELAYLLTIIPAAIPAASAEVKALQYAETRHPFLENYYLASLPSGFVLPTWVNWGPQVCLLESYLHL